MSDAFPPSGSADRGLLIIWHSRTGGSAALALAAHDGAVGADGAPVRMIAADDAAPADMLAAGGYLFICPENLATMSGAMKEFFDRCYYPLLGRIEGRAYATIICAGSDGTGAERQIDRIAAGWRLRRVADPMIIITDAQTPHAILAAKGIAPDALMQARQLGAALATGLGQGIF